MKLEARGVSFSWSPGTRPVLHDVDLDVPEGHVVALLGRNGGGKTTLIRLLLRLETPLSGSILLDGRPLAEYTRQDLARRIAWVPQGQDADFPYTTREYILMGRNPFLGPFQAPGTDDLLCVGEVLERLGLASIADRPVNRISGGERRLVLLARALAQEAGLLLLDEPNNHLDPARRAQCLGWIRQLGIEGRSVLFSTHDPNEALSGADRVVVLHEGRVLKAGTPEETIREDILEEVYGTRMPIHDVGGRRRVVDVFGG